MRDDFLFHCHLHRALAPILSELTPLGPPVGAALRRALVQPALKCGYRFEEEKLVEEMVAEVNGEHCRFWLLQPRSSGNTVTENAGFSHEKRIHRIGGVGGALAKHAEATLEKIGNDHVPIVRDLS